MEIRPEEKSRTQKKKEDRELQKLGERLLALSKDQLNAIDIPDELKEAVAGCHKIHSNTARQRQIQYIGVLMRSIDTPPLIKSLEYLDSGFSLKSSMDNDSSTTRWADTLISGDDSKMEVFLNDNPGAERQKLRQLIRNARKDSKHAKTLLNYIRSVEAG